MPFLQPVDRETRVQGSEDIHRLGVAGKKQYLMLAGQFNNSLGRALGGAWIETIIQGV
jgi:hypothetical protein